MYKHIMLPILVILILVSQISAKNQKTFLRSETDKQQVIKQINDDPNASLKFMIIGDYGTGTGNQTRVAEYFNTVAEQEQAQFVLGVGDNFYDPDGVESVNDENWNTKWKDVYQNKSYLKNLNWYGTLGNHDFGQNPYAEFQYKQDGWKIEDFFWAHTETVGSKSVAFIHVDTSFLAYGIMGELWIPHMKEVFKNEDWTSDEVILLQVEDLLKAYQDYDWIVAMGHHQIGYSCIEVGQVHKLYSLFQKYNVDAYLSGHSHTLAYDVHEDLTIVLSGAAGKSAPPECYKVDPTWSKAEIFGFMTMELTETQSKITAYYIEDDWQGDWQTYTFDANNIRSKLKYDYI